MDQKEKSHARINKSDAEWRAQLTPEQYRVTRQHGTERPYTSRELNEKLKGTFACVGCGTPLFSSETKFESGAGWHCQCSEFEAAGDCRHTREAQGRHAAQVLISNRLLIKPRTD